MRSNCKILSTEFKAKLRKIINTYPSQSIRFSQFMQLLSSNNIRIYSKGEVGKLSKIFDNPLKLCRIQVPLSHLMLDCVQQNQKQRYFIVKVSSNSVHSGLYEIKNMGVSTHIPNKCLNTLTKIMRRLYGNEKNWFKVLGGFTVAMTIDHNTFRRNLMKILCNTSHAGCVDSLTELFLKGSSEKDIEWKQFMKIISQLPITIESESISKAQSNQSSILSKQSLNFLKNHRYSFLQKANSNEKQSTNDMTHCYKNNLRRSRTIKTQYSENQENLLMNYDSLTLSSKKCILYEKKWSLRQSLYFSSNKSFKYNRIHNRKWNTVSNFHPVSKKTNEQMNEQKQLVYVQVPKANQNKEQTHLSRTICKCEQNCVEVQENQSRFHVEV